MLFYHTLLGFLITFLILWNLRTSNKANLYLFFFFLINNIYSLSHYAAMDSGNKYLIAIMLVHFTPLYLLIGPFLYFYVRGLVYDDHKLYKKDIIHFIPAIFILINISPYLFFSFDQKLFFATEVIRDTANILNNNFLFISPTISFITRPILIIPYVIFSASLIYKKGLNTSTGDGTTYLTNENNVEINNSRLLVLYGIAGGQATGSQINYITVTGPTIIKLFATMGAGQTFKIFTDANGGSKVVWEKIQ